MIKKKAIFEEDDCLIHDPDYGGIHEWWKNKFGLDFAPMWRNAKYTQEDGGDCVIRTLYVKQKKYHVLSGIFGYSVYEEEGIEV